VAVPFLKARLKPAATLPDAQVRALVAQLGAKEFKTRDQAAAQLKRHAEQAAVVLREALQAPLALEARRRIEVLLETVSEREVFVGAGERLRQVRAVQALEALGTAEARALLQTLAAGAPGAYLTQDAREALARLRGEQGAG
jgi:hypothetical protein